VVRKAHEQLAAQGLGIGNMLQHTIYMKDGSASPMLVLQTFHVTATKLAPSLKEFRSVGGVRSQRNRCPPPLKPAPPTYRNLGAPAGAGGLFFHLNLRGCSALARSSIREQEAEFATTSDHLISCAGHRAVSVIFSQPILRIFQ
jgi:hypothetical protein